MKKIIATAFSLSIFLAIGCSNDTTSDIIIPKITVNFSYKNTIKVGGEGAAEISTFDPKTKKLFIVNTEGTKISVYNIANLNQPIQKSAIPIPNGSPNSVSTYNGKLAVAVENKNKQNNGEIRIYNTENQSLENTFEVGPLPDMVTFSKDGKFIVCANEGEPNQDYTIDPIGSVSIIALESKQVTTLDFSSFNSMETNLENKGFRVFGPNASLAQDVEPEYITISDDSKTAWVSLQENNGLAKINLITKNIEAIYPLGFKDYNDSNSSIDPSDKDNKKELRKVPVYGMYQPDGIAYVNINGSGYIVSANEGDSREYLGTPGFINEKRVKELSLDPTKFPASQNYQLETNLGRLKVALDIGDTDKDGDYDQLYSYGTRSFSIWSENGDLVYDSGNDIATQLLSKAKSAFNNDDQRSDDKGAEPENVEILNLANQRYVLFVGLEKTHQVLVYDITNPKVPLFMTLLSHAGDKSPEGLLVIPASNSPSGRDLLIVSNEGSGTVSIYENIN